MVTLVVVNYLYKQSLLCKFFSILVTLTPPSGPQVEYIDITLEPTAPPTPVNQTHIDISIYNGYPQSSSTDSDFASRVISPSDISVSPPSYEEVTRNDPPSYVDAHKYPIDKS